MTNKYLLGMYAGKASLSKTFWSYIMMFLKRLAVYSRTREKENLR